MYSAIGARESMVAPVAGAGCYSPALKATFISVTLMLCQQFSGIGAILFYGGELLQNAGIADPNLGAAISQIVQFSFTVVAVLLIDRLGRRPLLLTSAMTMLSATVLLGWYFYREEQEFGYTFPPVFAALMVCLFYVGFALGMGAIPWLLMSELAPARARGWASGATTFTNWVVCGLVSAIFPTMQRAIGRSYSFWVFSGMLVASVFFISIFVPETKGQSLEAIEEYFQGRRILPPPPTRDKVRESVV